MPTCCEGHTTTYSLEQLREEKSLREKEPKEEGTQE